MQHVKRYARYIETFQDEYFICYCDAAGIDANRNIHHNVNMKIPDESNRRYRATAKRLIKILNPDRDFIISPISICRFINGIADSSRYNVQRRSPTSMSQYETESHIYTLATKVWRIRRARDRSRRLWNRDIIWEDMYIRPHFKLKYLVMNIAMYDAAMDGSRTRDKSEL